METVRPSVCLTDGETDPESRANQSHLGSPAWGPGKATFTMNCRLAPSPTTSPPAKPGPCRPVKGAIALALLWAPPRGH